MPGCKHRPASTGGGEAILQERCSGRGWRRIAALLLAAASLAPASEFSNVITDTVESAQTADELYEAVHIKPGKLNIIPVPVVDPTIGNGGALTALYTFALGDDPDVPRSTAALGAAYTDSESWVAGGGVQTYFAGDRIRLGAQGGYGNVNLKFYGLGRTQFFVNNPVDFAVEGTFAQITAQASPFENMFLGVRARLLNTTISLDAPIPRFPNLTTDITLVGIGPTLEYDTRDSTWWPSQGVRGKAELLFYDEALGSDSNFKTFNSEISYYHHFTDKLVLATSARLAGASDGAPFFMQPFVSVRGFPAGRFLNSWVAEAQAELRWTVWKKLGLVAFAGAGTTAAEFGELGDGPGAVGVGAGIRYRVSEEDKMNVGIDFAYGDHDYSFYFRIGEAF